MPSAFENASATPAIPITFVTKSSWEAVRGSLPPHAAQFALANGFAAKPGACLVLPRADGRIDQRLARLQMPRGLIDYSTFFGAFLDKQELRVAFDDRCDCDRYCGFHIRVLIGKRSSGRRAGLVSAART